MDVLLGTLLVQLGIVAGAAAHKVPEDKLPPVTTIEIQVPVDKPADTSTVKTAVDKKD